MNGMYIIGKLEALGYSFKLAIDYESPDESSPEAKALLAQLAEQRDAAIDYLIAGRFVPLPDDFTIPAEWHLNQQTRRYIFDAPEQILRSIGDRHSPIFALLWSAKALCFVHGGKAVYERIETAVRDVYGFDYEKYAADWKRYVELLDTSPGDVPGLMAEYQEVQARLIQAGAKI